MEQNSFGNIMENLKKNPFYRETDKELSKKINITEHLKSETPYIPIGNLKTNICGDIFSENDIKGIKKRPIF